MVMTKVGIIGELRGDSLIVRLGRDMLTILTNHECNSGRSAPLGPRLWPRIYRGTLQQHTLATS